MITALGLVLCVGILAFALGAIHGWAGGWVAGMHGFWARLISRAEKEERAGRPDDLDNLIRDRQRDIAERLPQERKD